MTIADTELMAITGASAAGEVAMTRLEQLAAELLGGTAEAMPYSISAPSREVHVVVID